MIEFHFGIPLQWIRAGISHGMRILGFTVRIGLMNLSCVATLRMILHVKQRAYSLEPKVIDFPLMSNKPCKRLTSSRLK